ncbi:hypothetical protein ACFQE8_09025 [Salinirubellus sp. GCM10025818]
MPRTTPDRTGERFVRIREVRDRHRGFGPHSGRSTRGGRSVLGLPIDER